MTRKEFLQHYWCYYLVLEEKFRNTLNYVELDQDNERTFSNEYALLLQAIGAELDNFFKVYCRFSPDDRKTIKDYCPFVLNRYRLYVQVELIKRELKINDDIVCKFVSSVEEMNQIEKSLEFPLVFVKQFLINTLNSLQEIKSSYMHWEMFIHGSVEGV